MMGRGIGILLLAFVRAGSFTRLARLNKVAGLVFEPAVLASEQNP